MKKIVSTAILLLAFCLLVCAQASADASPAALADMPAALYAEQTPDGQLALLADISVRFADTLETGGWDVDLNAVLAGELPEGFLPEDFEAAVSAEGALPEALRGLRFAALYDDKGTLRLLGDFAARLPAGTLVSSLDEAQAVLLLRHSLTSRSDYIGSAYNRHYDLYAWEIGSDTVYTLFGLTTFPPAAGRGTLSGEELGMETLWGHARDLFFDAVTVEDAYGTMTFRITGAGCYLAEVTGDRTVLEIPQEVNGYPVTGIAKCGLSGLPSLVEVCLPDTVLWIGDRAFYGCEALRTVNLPEGLESIGNYAFSYDEELQTLAFPSSLRTIGEHAFSSSSYEIKGITAFDFSEGLVSIGDYAVTGSNTLERVTLPSTLTSIGKGFLEYGGSFLWLVVPDGITKLEKDFLMSADHTLCIYLPESVGSFEDNLLDYGHITVYTPEGSAAARWAESMGYPWVACASPDAMPHPSLETEGDYRYAILEGEAILMEYVGEETQVIIPDTLGGYPVRTIKEDAFFKQEAITSIVIADSVRCIQSLAILKCGQMDVYIPASVPELENQMVFANNETIVIHAPEGSAAQQWALDAAQYNVDYQPWEP